MAELYPDGKEYFGNTGSYRLLGGIGTASTVAVVALDVIQYTGKKNFYIKQLNATNLTWALWGGYDPKKSELEVLAEAVSGTPSDTLQSLKAATVINATSDSYETTNALKWVILTILGNTATFNFYLGAS